MGLYDNVHVAQQASNKPPCNQKHFYYCVRIHMTSKQGSIVVMGRDKGLQRAQLNFMCVIRLRGKKIWGEGGA